MIFQSACDAAMREEAAALIAGLVFAGTATSACAE
jgi:hypothetical protein